MVEVPDTVELIIPGVGDGVGDGVGVGVGEAVGAGDGDADCAWATDIAPIANTNVMAIRRANARPAPILRVREARDEQRINFIPEKSARSKKSPKGPVGRSGFAPSSCGASIGYGPQ
jgi:hypothetical protein